MAWDDTGRHFGQPVGDDFVAVSAGFDYSLALRADGSLVGWTGGYPVPEGLPSGNNFVAIAAGESHALALKADGSIVAWGNDGPTATGRAFPPPNVPNEGFKAIAAGTYHNLALKTDGSIVAWGSDGSGNQTTGRAHPPPGVDNTGFVAIAASENHNLALREDGTVVAWGRDLVGEVSDAPEGDGFVDVAAGFGYSMALRENGTVVVWGAENRTTPASRNYYAIAGGQHLGLGLYGEGRIGVIWKSTTDYGTPETDGFIAIASGRRHALAIKGVGLSLAITAPAPGATIAAGDAVEIAAAFPAEPSGVVRVEFFAGTTPLGLDDTAPYSIFWSEVPAGTHLLTARAVLDDDSFFTSAIVSITVVHAPVIVSPAHMDQFYFNLPIEIDVDLVGDGGPAERIEFYADSVKLGEDADAPYAFTWNNAAVGAYSLTARAFYPGGQSIRGDDVFISIVDRPRIVSPPAEEQFLTDAQIPIEVEIPGGTNGVESVVFYDGRTEIGRSSVPPFGFVWLPPTGPELDFRRGGHALRARVVYQDGRSRITKSVSVYVVNAEFPTIVSPANSAVFFRSHSGFFRRIPIVVVPAAGVAGAEIERMVARYRRLGYPDDWQVIGHDSEPPYTIVWNPSATGVWVLDAYQIELGFTGKSSKQVYVHIRDPKRDSIMTFLKDTEQGAPSEQAMSVVGGAVLRLLAATTSIDLDLLRRFRDEVLLATPAGRYFADLYETASPALIGAVLEDPSLIMSIYDAYDAWAPAIQAAVDGNAASITVTSEMTDALVDMLPRLRMVAEKNLRDLLQLEVEALDPASWSSLSVAGVLDMMEIQTRPPPGIASQSTSQAVAAGSGLTLSVEAEGAGPFEYQWYRNAVAISGATAGSYVLPSAQAFHAGEYSVTVANPFGETTSSSMVVSMMAPPASGARLLNLSTRAASLTGDNVLIPGLVVVGTGTKRLLIRGVGPTLATFGVNGVLADPLLTLKRTIGDTTTTIATNDNWGTAFNLADLLATTTAVGAFDLGSGSADAALLVDLEPGQYSVVTEGVGGGTGIAIVELYDADLLGVPTSSLINISTRGFVGTGEQVMIPGFVISSEGPKTLLIRAVGPTLGDFGVSGTLADPRLVVNRTETDGSNTPLLIQDNWGDNPDAANTATTADQVGAFALTAGSKDAAFVITLPPGVYTVVGSSADGTSTGVVLVEVYVVP